LRFTPLILAWETSKANTVYYKGKNTYSYPKKKAYRYNMAIEPALPIRYSIPL
jgi:hypothetical protein